MQEGASPAWWAFPQGEGATAPPGPPLDTGAPQQHSWGMKAVAMDKPNGQRGPGSEQAPEGWNQVGSQSEERPWKGQGPGGGVRASLLAMGREQDPAPPE